MSKKGNNSVINTASYAKKMYTDAHNVSEVNDRMALYKLKGCVKEPNMFHNYESEKITPKASDMAENLQ